MRSPADIPRTIAIIRFIFISEMIFAIRISEFFIADIIFPWFFIPTAVKITYIMIKERIVSDTIRYNVLIIEPKIGKWDMILLCFTIFLYGNHINLRKPHLEWILDFVSRSGDSMKTPKMKDKKNIIESKIFPETLKKI